MQPYRAWMANVTNQIQAWRFDEHDRYIVGAPITHGTSTYILPILAQGGCHVILPEAGAQAVRNAFRDRAGNGQLHAANLGLHVDGPTRYLARGLSESSAPDLWRRANAFRKIREVRAFFGPVLGTTYGQTEAPQIPTVMRPEDFEDPQRWSSVGATTWFSDVAIMSPEGRLLPSGEVGEVVARGDLLMTGYWNLPEKTAETLVDGWLHTGDSGFIDEAGFLYLKDRIRDLVITGGFNVYPVDVENALGQHPAVHECTVFGIPDDKWGDRAGGGTTARRHGCHRG